MKLGICLPHYGRPIEVGLILEVVRHAEARGLDSVWVTDHVIVPHDSGVISYTTYPAILETIDIVADRIRPRL
jgi:alkanesulfonate monooxygenase SsuD/methylene tetrahydromethanopterin reductase-like flavin-dependent oxidoreductase (luciferase family)